MQFVDPKSKAALTNYYDRWHGCKLCPISERANKVHWRGYCPCKILFVGEAPGVFENYQKYPFVGPAGHLLEETIEAVRNEMSGFPIWAITNCLLCLPDKNADEHRSPLPEQIANCSPRLEEFINIASPKAIVAIGEVAKKFFSDDLYTPVTLTHPAAILRLPKHEASIAQLKNISRLINLLERL